jgi:hypothetical protein
MFLKRYISKSINFTYKPRKFCYFPLHNLTIFITLKLAKIALKVTVSTTCISCGYDCRVSFVNDNINNNCSDVLLHKLQKRLQSVNITGPVLSH